MGEDDQPPNPGLVQASQQATPQQLFEATFPHQPLSQPIAYALTLPKEERKFTKHVVLGHGLIYIREGYLRKLELENHIYRRHLCSLERRLYENALHDVGNVIGLYDESTAAADTSIKKIRGLVAPKESLVALRPQARQPKAQKPVAKNNATPKVSNEEAIALIPSIALGEEQPRVQRDKGHTILKLQQRREQRLMDISA